MRRSSPGRLVGSMRKPHAWLACGFVAEARGPPTPRLASPLRCTLAKVGPHLLSLLSGPRRTKKQSMGRVNCSSRTDLECPCSPKTAAQAHADCIRVRHSPSTSSRTPRSSVRSASRSFRHRRHPSPSRRLTTARRTPRRPPYPSWRATASSSSRACTRSSRSPDGATAPR